MYETFWPPLVSKKYGLDVAPHVKTRRLYFFLYFDMMCLDLVHIGLQCYVKSFIVHIFYYYILVNKGILQRTVTYTTSQVHKQGSFTEGKMLQWRTKGYPKFCRTCVCVVHFYSCEPLETYTGKDRLGITVDWFLSGFGV